VQGQAGEQADAAACQPQSVDVDVTCHADARPPQEFRSRERNGARRAFRTIKNIVELENNL
jgi:hypothetical protein